MAGAAASVTVSGAATESDPVELGVVLVVIGSSASDTSLLGGLTSCGRPDVDVEPQPVQSNGPTRGTVPSDARNGHFPARSPSIRGEDHARGPQRPSGTFTRPDPDGGLGFAADAHSSCSAPSGTPS